MSENSTVSSKWKEVIVSALRKVQKQVHPTLTVHQEALVYLEELLLQLLHQLCSSSPHSISDIEDYIQNKFPQQIRGWAMDAAKSTIEKKKKKTLTLPVDKLMNFIIQKLGYKIEMTLAMYIIAVVEYISADILKLAGNYVKNIRNDQITAEHVKVAMYADPVLMLMFHNNEPDIHIEPVIPTLTKRGSLLYIEVLKDFLLSEEQYIRELNLIIKMFQQPMIDANEIFSSEDLDTIFSNILDIYETTVQFYGMIQTAFDVAGDKEPLIGDCFEEMAEGAEFECYDSYAYEQVTDSQGDTYERMKTLLNDSEVATFFKEKGLHDAVKFILPKLLYGPLYHFSDYFEYINLLMCTSPDGLDREKLAESLGGLRGLQITVEKVLGAPALRRTAEDKVFYQRGMGTSVPNATAKIVNIQESIDGWEGKHISQIASLFLKEGTLIKPAQDGKKATERKAFLFDNIMVLAKQNVRHTITGFSQAEYRFKERINLRKAEIKDIEDTEELQNCFEIRELDETPVLFCCKDDETKYEWLSILMTLQHRSTLDRMLDVILQEEEQSIELKLPDKSIYKFAEEDSLDNIIFEDSVEDDHGASVIKGGTLYKLVERLTYHKYADPTFIRVFLTTYRSFSNPVELLDLLMERYDIPEPNTISDKDSSNTTAKSGNGGLLTKEELKRFRKEFVHPIQLRVFNVLRHWVDHHFYDFERENLLPTLKKFLSRVVQSKTARKWVETIERNVNKKLEAANLAPEVYCFNLPTPPVEWHLTKDPAEFSILTLHPLEIARQLTIIQAEIFRAIRPSEVVGVAWVKSDKEKLSPNALRLMRLSTLLTMWYEVTLCEASNFEERCAIYTRIIDILMAFVELNNFNGIIEIISALNSSPVHRLKMTAEELQTKSPKKYQALQDVKELTQDAHHMMLKEKLKSINPPCVPFLGVYLSNILKVEEGNPDFLQNCPDGMINFSKRRMVADITGEIQTYQNMPYNLEVEDSIQTYLKNLDPFQGRTNKQMEDYLFDLSSKIEPRNTKKPAVFPRQNDLPLKSPGIKPSNRISGPNSGYKRLTSRSSTSSLLAGSESLVSLPRDPPQSPTESVSSQPFVVEDETAKAEEEEEIPPQLPPPELPPRELPPSTPGSTLDINFDDFVINTPSSPWRPSLGNQFIPPPRQPAKPGSPSMSNPQRQQPIQQKPHTSQKRTPQKPSHSNMMPIFEEDDNSNKLGDPGRPELPPRMVNVNSLVTNYNNLINQNTAPPPMPPKRTDSSEGMRARSKTTDLTTPPGLPPRDRLPPRSASTSSASNLTGSVSYEITPPSLPPRKKK